MIILCEHTNVLLFEDVNIPPMTDYQQLYDDKCVEFEELNMQFLAYQGTRPLTQNSPT